MSTRDSERAAGRPEAGQSGSIFVEAIISAAIVAMALAGTFRVISDNAGRDRAAEGRRAALLVAQSAMANVGSEIPLEPGRSAGLSGDMVWRVDITPFSQDDATNPVGDLLQVTVGVGSRAGGQRLVTLRTLRLGRPT